jgi:hypothetical protein
MNRSLAALLGCALALGASNSVASATASVQLSDFQFQLIDLDPNDGIAPSIDLSAYPGSRAYVGGNVDQASSVFGPVLITVSYEDGFLELASITGDLANGGSATTVATVGDVPTNYRFAGSTIVLGEHAASSLFTLSPRTQLVISGTVDITASTSRVDGFTGYARSLAEFALSTALIGFNNVDTDVAIIDAHDNSARSQQSDLSVALSNTTDAAMQGGFSVQLTSNASVRPVPEPGNLPLMLAALAGILSMVPRRRSNRPG